MKIKIKQRAAKKWSGVKTYANAKVFISPKLNKLGKVETGLTEEDRLRLEKAMNLTAGSLLPNSDFWTEFVVMISEGQLDLDLSVPEHELQYKVLLTQNDKFAKSLTEQSAKAEFVIFDEEQEAKKLNKNRSFKKDAYVVFGKMTPNEMRDVLTATGKKPDNTSNELVEAQLGDIVETTPELFLSLVNDKYFKERVVFKKLLQVGLLKKSGSMILYDKETLGHDEESAIAYLINPENSTVVEALKKQMKAIK